MIHLRHNLDWYPLYRGAAQNVLHRAAITDLGQVSRKGHLPKMIKMKWIVDFDTYTKYRSDLLLIFLLTLIQYYNVKLQRATFLVCITSKPVTVTKY